MTIARASESTFFEKTQAVCCSKPAIIGSVIVALAVAIIGALALVGILLPHTPLAAFGNMIGQMGSIGMVSSGGTAALVILLASLCSSKNQQGLSGVEHEYIPNRQPNQIPGGKGNTGASGNPGHRSNVSFD